jgi:hypothetical protein
LKRRFPDDADALAEMSRDIWRRHYLPGILSEAELNFSGIGLIGPLN